MEILNHDGLRAQSLLLCVKPEYIDNNNGDEGFGMNKNKNRKEFGFLSFLEKTITTDAVNELFLKFSNKTKQKNKKYLSNAQFTSILTLTVIIYKIRLFQIRTGCDDKEPEIDAEKIKISIQNFAIWCICKYGKLIEGKGYKIKFTKYDYSHNLCHWIRDYVANDGNL